MFAAIMAGIAGYFMSPFFSSVAGQMAQSKAQRRQAEVEKQLEDMRKW